jgi:hypothetical protein
MTPALFLVLAAICLLSPSVPEKSRMSGAFLALLAAVFLAIFRG